MSKCDCKHMVPLIKAIGKVVCVIPGVDQRCWVKYFYFEGDEAQVHVVKADSCG